jgi:hypothetical protein
MGEDVFRGWESSIQAEGGEVYMQRTHKVLGPVHRHFRHVK